MKIFKKYFAVTVALLEVISVNAAVSHGSGASALTQTPDTTGIYDGRADSLDATVFVGRQNGNYLSKGKELRTEVISSAGLKKMACCNLA